MPASLNQVERGIETSLPERASGFETSGSFTSLGENPSAGEFIIRI